MAVASDSSGASCGIPPIPVGEHLVQFTNPLGSGTFGTVYRATNKHGKPIAIKQINMENNDKVATSEYAAFAKLNSIGHENIVKIHNVLSIDNNIWVAMELCNYGDLNKYFINRYFKQHLTEAECIKARIRFMEQIANGIAFLHSKNIVHRDIKPTNILVQSLNASVRLKLTDFGLARNLDPDGSTSAMSTDLGTPQYKAPEFWRKTPFGHVRYHKNIDIFATGLTFLSILQAKPGDPLKPNVEDPLIAANIRMSIGAEMIMREDLRQPEINVAVCNKTDSPMVKAVKVLVQRTTSVRPERRPNAEWVLSRLGELLDTSGVRESLDGQNEGEKTKVNTDDFTLNIFNILLASLHTEYMV